MGKRIQLLFWTGTVALGIGAGLWGLRGGEDGDPPGMGADSAGTGDEMSASTPTALLPVADWEGTALTARGVVSGADGRRLELSALDHEFAPLEVAANESLEFRVELRDADVSAPVLLEADNGGILDGRPGACAKMPDSGGGVEFRYVAGGNTGKYTVCLSQGRRQEMMEIRVRPAGDET